MEIENKPDEDIITITGEPDGKKIKLPLEIQKRFLEFFMRTSIPRNKANNNKTALSEKKEE